jgi:hypothetical protein
MNSEQPKDTKAIDQMGIPCCPDLNPDGACDVLDFHYRLTQPTAVTHNNQRVGVEVLIHARIERCPGPMALGDLVYSNTLLPGEKVSLFTTDRRTQFTFDTSSKVSYRNEQTSEERYFMSSMSDFMSDIESRDESHGGTTSKGSSEGHASTSGAIESFFVGPSVNVGGSYNASSTSDFMREVSQHARASSNRSEQATRTANSVSVGEVQTRTHAEGETADHFEASSRTFSNPNHCHAITFFFYQINKTQTIRFSIESITRRVIDPAADTRVINPNFASRGQVDVIPNAVLATDKERLEAEARGRASVAAEQQNTPTRAGVNLQASFSRLNVQTLQLDPIPGEVRLKALQEVDAQLVAAKLIARAGGDITTEAKRQFSFEIQSSLPTPGMFVRGCLDDCNICEEEVQEDIKLDLDHKRLKNKLLERQIELLDKAQEYRCCPDDEDEEV